jgi:hypothetical protein
MTIGEWRRILVAPVRRGEGPLTTSPIVAGADFEPANPPKQLSNLIIDYRLS